jgi:N-acetyl-anhydromuramyl-L-alanine amidase AmpD
MIGTDEFNDEQWSILKDLVLKKKIQYPNLKVIGHNEVSKKSCPGFNVQWWLNKVLTSKGS